MKASLQSSSADKVLTEEKIKKLQEHPWLIKHEVYQSEELCLEAVKKNPQVLCLVREQTEQICLEAVKRDYCTVAYVRDLTDAVVREAIFHNPDAVYYLPKSWFDKYKVPAGDDNSVALHSV